MNPHPFFVHFPIALLTVYALLEVVAFFSKNTSTKTRGIRVFLAIVGIISVFPTLFTGELAEENLISADSQNSLIKLVETHSNFATATAVIFSILAVSYLLTWIKLQMTVTVAGDNHKSIGNIADDEYKNQNNAFWKFIFWLNSRYPATLLSILGLIAVTITGALGGAIVYGPNVDPVVNFIYKLLL